MAELTYPTDVSFAGPWLLGMEHLERLDEILDREIATLQNSAERRLSESVEKQLAALESIMRTAPVPMC